jgi:hypothetical protein
LAVRAGFLVAMRTNLFKIAENLRWGLVTREYAEARGITPEYQAASKKLYDRVQNFFVDAMQGDEAILKKEILDGAPEKLQGLGVVAAASTAAAAGALATVTAWMDDIFKGITKVKAFTTKTKDAISDVKSFLPQNNKTSVPSPSPSTPSTNNSSPVVTILNPNNFTPTSYETTVSNETPEFSANQDGKPNENKGSNTGLIVLGFLGAAGIAYAVSKSSKSSKSLSGPSTTKKRTNTKSKSKSKSKAKTANINIK